jgi:hypothetical protein
MVLEEQKMGWSRVMQPAAVGDEGCRDRAEPVNGVIGASLRDRTREDVGDPRSYNELRGSVAILS